MILIYSKFVEAQSGNYQIFFNGLKSDGTVEKLGLPQSSIDWIYLKIQQCIDNYNPKECSPINY